MTSSFQPIDGQKEGHYVDSLNTFFVVTTNPHPTIDLSIIIVNYNARFFLNLCLFSVEKALAKINGEVIIVDNHSHDSSLEMVATNYPFARVINNSQNVGFSVANNQAIKEAKGRIILLLNPDTIVGEDTFSQLIEFYSAHPDATGIGSMMVDGSGHYLPESKRGFPTPWVSFCKMAGLTRLFPTSPKLARYYMGHLSDDEKAKVEVLSGAFLAFPKTILQKTHALDESFFMYGEDIDFSFRLSQINGGNYYVPEITIIHFKGECTTKNLAYNRRFYQAMLLFTKLHLYPDYSKFKQWLITNGIRLATLFSGSLVLLRSLFPSREHNSLPSTEEFFIGHPEKLNSFNKNTGKTIQLITFEKLANRLKHPSTKKQSAPSVFIDMASTPTTLFIDFMKTHADQAHYFFISPDGKYYLHSPHSSNPGCFQQISRTCDKTCEARV
ncbi:glycosyltransferase family 2 protein [Marinilabiliaceae bacterium JC017]|nr:glycosyltransferase family 2 protein [Marinilabiliaceae bacterium JC017]